MRTLVSRALGTLLAATTLATLAATPASATPDPCPGGAEPCVYLAGGSYTLGNPVTETVGAGPSTTAVLTHCDSNGGNCSDVVLNLPGVTLQSTETAILTLHVPGEGVALDGTRPVLYLGVPTATPGTARAGLSLTISGTPFVIWDTAYYLVWECFTEAVPKLVSRVSGHVGNCSYSFTVSV